MNDMMFTNKKVHHSGSPLSSSSTLTLTKKQDFRAAFDTFDTTGDGYISREELEIILKRFGHRLSKEELSSMFERLDANNDRRIGFEEFMEILTSQIPSSTQGSEHIDLQIAFDLIDTDSSGTISSFEIIELLKKCNPRMKSEEIDIVLEDCGILEHQNKTWNFEEFKKFMSYEMTSPEPLSPMSNLKYYNMKKMATIAYSRKVKDLVPRSDKNNRFSWIESPTFRFRFVVVAIPLFVAVYYSIAIMFPPEARHKAPFLIWTNGELVHDDEGILVQCPRSSICSEGFAQIIMIGISRITAFSSYVVMAITFVSKMHCTTRFLANTVMSDNVPFERMHHIHSIMGKWYAVLAVIHTICHLIRWGLRAELSFIIETRPGLSGLFGILFLLLAVLSMTLAKRFKRISFDVRFSTHWFFVLLVFAISFHTPRCGLITCIFFFLWFFDYLYLYIVNTHRLDVVEFTPLPNNGGTQMLWRNPKGFKVTSGQYVKVRVPWLTEGGKEWHPFSVYMKEKTVDGLKNKHKSDHSLETGLVDDITDENVFVREVLMREYEKKYNYQDGQDTIDLSKREEMEAGFGTTQVFIAAVGDWSSRLNREVYSQMNLSSCWVRGPFVSPYHLAHSFSHLILTATGIGITPSLGVAGQYKGNARTKVLIWSVKSLEMLLFFSPLLSDFHFALIYYTGPDPISVNDAYKVRSNGNVFLKTKRGDFNYAIACVITSFESSTRDSIYSDLKSVPIEALHAWSVLYCGGSRKVLDSIASFSNENDIHFHYEVFDW